MSPVQEVKTPSLQEEKPFIPFARPCLSENEIQEVVECLRSGWLTTGPRVQKLEQDLKAYCGAPYALTFHSATAGLLSALKALELGSDDEVITTPMTFVATANVIVQAGARPVFVDIDEHTYNIDVAAVERAITPRTRAIIPVHFDGLPVDLDPLYDLAKEHYLHVIEDAAHAIGAAYKGRPIGSFGDTQVFSFHPNKNMTTGEGGCVTTRDESWAEFMTTFRFHGIDRSAWNRFGKGGSQHYDVCWPGYKFNMMDLQAALGIHQLERLESFIERRTLLANRYQDLLKDWPEVTLPQKPSYPHRHAWHQFAVCINPEKTSLSRDAFMAAMQEENIGTGLQYLPVHLFSFYRKAFGYKEGDFPKAEKVGQTIVSLPLFPELSFEDQDRVIAAMKKIFGKENEG